MSGRIVLLLCLVGSIWCSCNGVESGGDGNGADDLEQKLGLLEELSRDPLGKNPFFMRQAAAAFAGKEEEKEDDKHDGGGEGESDKKQGDDQRKHEGLQPASSGYFCRSLGNLECGDDFDLVCEGKGVIDCIEGCPGDESAFKEMMSKTQDDAFLSQFPRLKAMLRKNKTSEEEEKGRQGLIRMLSECGDGFEDYIVLLETAGSFGAEDPVSDDPSSATYVAEEAVSGWDEYEYEEDYGDEEEGEEEKNEIDMRKKNGDGKRGERSSRQTSGHHNGERRARVPRIPKSQHEEKEEMQRRSRRSVADKAAASVAGEDLYALHQIGRLAARAGLVGQIGTELHVRLPSPPDGSSADASDPDASDADEMEAGEDEDDWRKSRRLDGGRRKKIKRIPRSVSPLVVSSGDSSVTPATPASPPKCVARGDIRCVTLPTVGQCTGIRVGGCIDRVSGLVMKLNPRVVFGTVISVVAVAVTVGGGTYYVIKKRYLSSVAPVSNGTVPTVRTEEDGGGGGDGDNNEGPAGNNRVQPM